jgi:molecular chaperone DnaK (HSP70)
VCICIPHLEAHDEIDGIVLAGGTTHMPIVRGMVEVFFKKPILMQLPAGSVA